MSVLNYKNFKESIKIVHSMYVLRGIYRFSLEYQTVFDFFLSSLQLIDGISVQPKPKCTTDSACLFD